MLSEREQQVLDDIELRIALDDPRFAAVMSGHDVLSWRRIVATYLVSVAVVLMLVLTFLTHLYALGACVASGVAALLIGYTVAYWQRHRVKRRLQGRFA